MNTNNSNQDHLHELPVGLRQAVQSAIDAELDREAESRALQQAMALTVRGAEQKQSVLRSGSRKTSGSNSCESDYDQGTVVGPTRSPSSRNRFLGSRLTWIGAAIAASVALAIFALPGVMTSRAFAEVKRAIQELTSVSFVATSLSDEGKISKVTLVGDSKARAELADGTVMVLDMSKRKSMLVRPGDKTALIFGGLKAEPSVDLFRVLREIKSDSVEKIKPKEIAGESCPGYRFGDHQLTYRLWVDPATKLPVYGESASKDSDTAVLLMDRFAFNIELNSDDFDVAAPSGYAVTKRTLPPQGGSLGSKQLTLVPLKGLGSVEFGMTKNEVAKALGNPQETKSIEQTGGTLLIYDHLGVRLTLDKAGQLDDITCYVNNEGMEPLVVTFGGTTDKGIAMTATADEIIMAYGKPDRDRENSTPSVDGKGTTIHRNLVYDKMGLDFRLRNGQLTYLSARVPSSPECYPTQP